MRQQLARVGGTAMGRRTDLRQIGDVTLINSNLLCHKKGQQNQNRKEKTTTTVKEEGDKKRKIYNKRSHYSMQ